MSSRTSSRSTLTTVPSTMSPSLKYLMVSSIAARNASSDPMSLTATLGVELACVLLVIVWAGSGCGQDRNIARAGNVGGGSFGQCFRSVLLKHCCCEGPRTRGTHQAGLRLGTPRRPTVRPPDHDRPHEDTAQRSEYEV